MILVATKSNILSYKEKQETQTPKPEMSTKTAVKPAEMNTKHREQRAKDVFVIPLSRIRIEEDFNKRTDDSYGDIDALADSIQAMGQIQHGFGHANADGTWTLTAGHRRFAALLKIAKRTKQEQTMKLMKTDDKEVVTRLLIQYTENVKHPTNDFDKALIIGGLINGGLKQKDIVTRLGIPQPVVSNLVKLLKTPEVVQQAMRNKEISTGTVSKLLKTMKDDQEGLAQEVESAKAAAKAEGKTKATDRHSKAAGTRTPQTIMKQLVAKYQPKVEAEEELSDAETFALAFCQKLLTKPSDQALTNFLRNYGKK